MLQHIFQDRGDGRNAKSQFENDYVIDIPEGGKYNDLLHVKRV